MSSVKPNVKPYLVLMATDRSNIEHETENRHVSEKQILKLKPGTYELWLRIDYQKMCPSDGQQVNSSKQEEHEDVPLDRLKRIFDTDKRAEMDKFLKPGDDSQKRMMGQATTGNKFPLGYHRLDAEKYELKLIGPINFKYLDETGKPRVFEEMHLDLSFWFHVSDEEEDAPLEEDDDQSGEPAYFTEDQLM